MRRFRRLRTSTEMRSLVRETRLSKSELIYPLFVIEGEDIRASVPSMPGIYQWSPDRVDEELDMVEKSGRPAVIREIAASLSRDIDFFPRLLVLFQHRDGGTGCRGGCGSHEPGGAGADHQNAFVFHAAILHQCFFSLQ